MKLLPPKIVSPVSVCNTEIEIEGILTGAMVHVHRGSLSGEIIADETIAKWSRQRLQLKSGVTLQAGDKLFAVQAFQGETSGATASPVKVIAAPEVPSSLIVTSPIYACASSLKVDGAVPGAVVEVGVIKGGTFEPRGESKAITGTARGVPLSPEPQVGEVLVTRQSFCDSNWFLTTLPPAVEPPADNLQLPQPFIEEPVRACTRHVTVWGVVPGAEVTLSRNGVETTMPFDVDGIFFVMDPPLEENEQLKAVQRMAQACDLTPGESKIIRVGPPRPPEKPSLGKVCSGHKAVQVGGLEAGARIELYIDDGPDPIGVFEASRETATVPLASSNIPLPTGKKLRVRQGYPDCNLWSEFDEETIKAGGEDASLELPGPLYACAGAVYVIPLPHSVPIEVDVMSTKLAGSIGHTLATVTNMQVSVKPSLIEGDHIYAVGYACNGSVVKSEEVEVLAFPDVPPAPAVYRAQDGSRDVWVEGYLQGATVDVFIDGVWVASDLVAYPPKWWVTVPDILVVGHEVQVRQRLCDKISPMSDIYVVIPKPPVAAYTVSPIPPAGPAPFTVQFIDKSSGVVTDWEWNFDDGSPPLKGIQNPKHTFYKVGFHTPIFEAIGPGGSDSNVDWTIEVTEPEKPLDNTPDKSELVSVVLNVDTSQAGLADLIEILYVLNGPQGQKKSVTATYSGGTAIVALEQGQWTILCTVKAKYKELDANTNMCTKVGEEKSTPPIPKTHNVVKGITNAVTWTLLFNCKTGPKKPELK